VDLDEISDTVFKGLMPGSYAQQYNDIYCSIGYLSIRKKVVVAAVKAYSQRICEAVQNDFNEVRGEKSHNSSSFLLGLRGSFVRPIHFYEAAPTKRLIDERPRILTA
jgi:hypothetical protein